MSDRWAHVMQIGMFLGGGIACLVLGQIPVGTALIGAAIGNALPTSLIARKENGSLPPGQDGPKP